jgi:hypothetical protein
LKRFQLLLSIVTLWLFSSLAWADITKEQSLDFGKIAVINNATSSTLSILSDGTQITDTNFVVLAPGQAGRYFLYNFPPSTALSITLSGGSTVSEFSGSPPPTQFSIEPYLDFGSYSTNALGELTLLVPGKLKTTGDSNPYIDGTYYRHFQLFINY